jgi:hypothetical protein
VSAVDDSLPLSSFAHDATISVETARAARSLFTLLLVMVL